MQMWKKGETSPILKSISHLIDDNLKNLEKQMEGLNIDMSPGFN